jgi:hypothetical protein
VTGVTTDSAASAVSPRDIAEAEAVLKTDATSRAPRTKIAPRIEGFVDARGALPRQLIISGALCRGLLTGDYPASGPIFYRKIGTAANPSRLRRCIGAAFGPFRVCSNVVVLALRLATSGRCISRTLDFAFLPRDSTRRVGRQG